ncbi:hypothetical protein P171DRAFT_520779 [Karstenula rhodostoma CBS 690.94]|uniref:Uncharacterized protein n=1 Tax=Karstenula rhodostoma CBS 690.94 TaxID=1392251 RepID=A0A9P4UBY6_9PLEO|nr:hypothetical protein P171DRAFT_520779 [Karstenula rhodostoma CBS 690.94]
MVGFSFGRKTLWQYSHSASILFAVLLFTAGFLCTLLWTNDIVHTETSAGGSLTGTFTSLSPAVSTFSITYQVAIFGTAWNAILFVTLLILERDDLPISTTRLRYEIEKSACIVAIAGNAIYSVACIALMATLARLAADASSKLRTDIDLELAKKIADSASDRAAGQGVTAAIAGVAAFCALWACFMDELHAQNNNRTNLLRFIKKVSGVLIKFGSEDGDHEKLRQRYMDDILRGLTAKESLCNFEELLRGNSRLLWPPGIACDDRISGCGSKKVCTVIRKDLDGEQLHEDDMLSAASAVENLLALDHYVKIPHDLFKCGEII